MTKDKRWHQNIHRRGMEKLNDRRRKRARVHIDRQKADENESSGLTTWAAIGLASLIRRSRFARRQGKAFERRRT